MSGREPSQAAVPGRSPYRLRPGALPRIFASVRPAEAASVALFFCHAFLLLVCYYLLKTLREPLLLAEGSPEIKSYAQAAIALVLLVLVPFTVPPTGASTAPGSSAGSRRAPSAA